MTRAEEWLARLATMPDDDEPIGCWRDGCYLAIDPRDGFCEAHGLPCAEEDAAS